MKTSLGKYGIQQDYNTVDEAYRMNQVSDTQIIVERSRENTTHAYNLGHRMDLTISIR